MSVKIRSVVFFLKLFIVTCLVVALFPVYMTVFILIYHTLGIVFNFFFVVKAFGSFLASLFLRFPAIK